MARRRKPAEYEEARRLRRDEGMPYKRIASRLGISVSSAHSWTRDIVLTPEQTQRNLTGPRGPRSPEAIAKFVRTWSEKNRDRRREHQREGRLRAKQGDLLHQAGCMLFWAEGSKRRNEVRFTNSDREMVKLFVRFLKESLGVTRERITLRLNVYATNGLTLREIEDHWLWALDLPRTGLRKHMINHRPTSSSGKKVNKLPYGVCTIRVLGSTANVQHIFGAIQEYGGFEESRWLDAPPHRHQRSAEQ